MSTPRFKRLIECYVPIYACNFRCDYCYIKQNPSRDFESRVEKFMYSPEYIAKCLSKKRLGGTCLINLCAGGETLLSEEVVELAKYLLEDGHFVMIVNNGTCTKNIQKLCDFPDNLKERLWLRFSLHWLELKRLNLIDRFFDNVKNCKNNGISIGVEMVASDDYIPFIPEIIKKCNDEIKSLPEINIARKDPEFTTLTNLSEEEYIKTWSVFNSKSFDLKLKTVGVKRKEFCYAGDWSVTLDLGNGNMSKCYSCFLQNIFKNPNSKIKFEAMGKKCPLPYCHNSHLWMAIGNIPTLEFPTLLEIRSKECSDGTHWLSKTYQDFISQKVYENNKQYSLFKRAVIKMSHLIRSLISKLKRLIRKVFK